MTAALDQFANLFGSRRGAANVEAGPRYPTRYVHATNGEIVTVEHVLVANRPTFAFWLGEKYIKGQDVSWVKDMLAGVSSGYIVARDCILDRPAVEDLLAWAQGLPAAGAVS